MENKLLQLYDQILILLKARETITSFRPDISIAYNPQQSRSFFQDKTVKDHFMNEWYNEGPLSSKPSTSSVYTKEIAGVKVYVMFFYD